MTHKLYVFVVSPSDDVIAEFHHNFTNYIKKWRTAILIMRRIEERDSRTGLNRIQVGDNGRLVSIIVVSGGVRGDCGVCGGVWWWCIRVNCVVCTNVSWRQRCALVRIFALLGEDEGEAG